MSNAVRERLGVKKSAWRAFSDSKSGGPSGYLTAILPATTRRGPAAIRGASPRLSAIRRRSVQVDSRRWKKLR